MKYELILFDVDSTLIKEEVIDLLAEKSGHGPEVSQITARAMRGEIDFLQALEMRLALLEGLPESVFEEVLSQISLSDGFSELFEYLHRNHFLIGAVSGGFHNVLDKLFADLNLDFLRANTLEVKDSKITTRAMRGEIDFLQALEMRIALLEGLPESIFDEVLSQITFSEGFSELFEYLRRNHFLIGAVSGGFHNVLDKLFADLNLDFLRANTLEVKNSKISGKLLSQPIDRVAKGQALKEFAASHEIKLEQTVAVGDGANDLEMIELAGIGVSYMGKEILKSRADLHLDRPGLDALIQYLK